MSKKKILTIALCAALVAALVIGGSIAYFTDTKEATNTFTIGGVKIELLEKQRNEDFTALEDFEQDKLLMPIVGSAQGEKDPTFGMPTAPNYVDKIVTVENTGKSPAWVRAYFAIPAALDDGYDTFNAGLNVLHFNFGVKPDGTSTDGTEWIWFANNKWNYYEVTIDRVYYNVYYADYATALPAGETTEQLVQGLYLDTTFDVGVDDTGADVYTVVHQGATVTVDMSEFLDQEGKLGKISCPVFAVAVQADGFDNAAAAIDAAFGQKFDPFEGTGATNWQQY